MLEKTLIGLALIVAVVVVVVVLQPAEYTVTRRATIAAPPAAVFAKVNDLHEFQTWNPFAVDPAAKNTFEGASAGTGAVLAWSGNAEVGEGRMTITESRPNELIRVRLDFVRPFASTAVAEFTFTPEGGMTSVTWSMTGRKNFVAKTIGLVMSMDRMIGGRFEQGLARLKSLSETAAAARR
jgi:uncharacterized protein YndB with AHSA1/START domain